MKPNPKPKMLTFADVAVPTGDIFVYRIDPEPRTKPEYIISTPNFKMYRKYDHMSESHKTYIFDNCEITEIDGGAYIRLIQDMAGLSDEAALEFVRREFRQGRIKEYSDTHKRKMYSHR